MQEATCLSRDAVNASLLLTVLANMSVSCIFSARRGSIYTVEIDIADKQKSRRKK